MDSYFELLCGVCGEVFNTIDVRVKHEELCRMLNEDSEYFTRLCDRREHCDKENPEGVCGPPPNKRARIEPNKRAIIANLQEDDDMYEYETAFQSRMKSCFFSSKKCLDLPSFLSDVKPKLITYLENILKEYTAIKVNILVECVFANINGEEVDRAFKTINKPIFQVNNLEEFIDTAIASLLREKEESEMKKSGWSLKRIDGLRLRINKYNPLRINSYIPLPPKIHNKTACINVQNQDQKCFKYAILAKFIPSDPQRVSNYAHVEDKYNFSCISFPTTLHEIEKFEKVNNISVNVFGINKGDEIYPLKVVDKELTDHRDLLVLNNNSGNNHYVYIKNFERLVHNQLTKHNGTIKICKRCFTKFDSQGEKSIEEKLEEHQQICNNHKAVRIELPTKKPYLMFENVEKCLRVPFVVYCDFESILMEVQGCQPDPSCSYTVTHHRHIPMSFCVYVKVAEEEVANISTNIPFEPFLYRGKDAAKKLLIFLKGIAEEVSRIYNLKTPMKPLDESEKINFDSTDVCYMCDKKFTSDDVKVRDHCHITGSYRGAAHNSCNLRYQNPNFLPILFHNLSGYDSHFIINELGYDEEQIDVIPNSEERYISFSKRINKFIKLRFVDSYRFIPSSLDSLARNSPTLLEIKKFFSPDHLHLLTRKGIFPYEYITSWEKLEETSLPTKSHFYNRLIKAHISDEDYEHALQVWRTFGCRTLGEYSDHYLKTDVLLLADVFENFRNITLKTHKLDPCHFFTLPSLTWDAMLRYTGIKLELLQDYDQIMMVEMGIRGGICQVSHRLISANNKYMEDYDASKESIYITYQDCNNLYGYAMTKPLPYGEFKWVSAEKINVIEMEEEDDIGYILDVDVEYPRELYQSHNDLPFLAETLKIGNEKKLVCHLNKRSRYVVHYMALKQAIQHGLQLKKIHRVLQFKQSKWLEPYIIHNNNLRTKAASTFERDLYKLYNNAVYGKTMENIRKRLNIKLVSGAHQIEKMISKTEFIDRTIYNENLAAVHLAKKKILFNKPIYIGMAILDVSKTIMYGYHYDVMLPTYGLNKLKLAYMDTDSFIYSIKTEDLFQDMLKLKDYLDTSDYPMDHPNYSIQNKKVLGKFKDEAKGRVITGFAGLRAKMYSIQIHDDEIKKAKGVQTAALKKNITFNDYLKCLKLNKEIRLQNTTIQSKLHQVYTLEINKLALSPHDNKRIIEKDGISTRAIGYPDD